MVLRKKVRRPLDGVASRIVFAAAEVILEYSSRPDIRKYSCHPFSDYCQCFPVSVTTSHLPRLRQRTPLMLLVSPRATALGKVVCGQLPPALGRGRCEAWGEAVV